MLPLSIVSPVFASIFFGFITLILAKKLIKKMPYKMAKCIKSIIAMLFVVLMILIVLAVALYLSNHASNSIIKTKGFLIIISPLLMFAILKGIAHLLFA